MKIKSILSILFFCIFVSSVSSQSSNTNNTEQNTRSEIFIKYDGVYFIPYAGGFSNEYIRFFEDGKVITVNSTGSPVQVKNWFNYEDENVSRGEFSIDGNLISFTTAIDEISVEYIGIISSNGLLLDSRSSNGNESKGLLFVFYKW